VRIEKIVGKMDLLVRDNNQAKATVDFALHDLKGKLLGVPVYELLGGRTTESARQGWVLSAGKPDDVAAEAKRAKDIGFALFKMKIGYGTLQDDIDMVHAVRETVGPDAYLTIDANGFWSYEKALHIIRKIDSAGLDLIEQPLPTGTSKAWPACAPPSRRRSMPTNRHRSCTTSRKSSTAARRTVCSSSCRRPEAWSSRSAG
jgi:L-alanine-DL-glutamate epimerase-like enolase superfamily enzyme